MVGAVSTAFLRLSPARRLRLVIIYPGTGYGSQDYVINRIEGLNLGDPKVLIAIAESYNTSWWTVVEEVHAYASQEGLQLKPSALIGWSGGARGVINAVEANHDFPEVLLADPSPLREAFEGRDTRIWYNPDNWRGRYEHLGPRQAEYAEPLGDRAILVPLDHNQILDEVIKTAVGRRTKVPPALIIGIPALLLIWAFAARGRD